MKKLILLVPLFLIGCVSTKEFNHYKRRSDFVSEHPEINFKKAILDGVIEIGMNREMVLSILGNPMKIEKESEKESWCYDERTYFDSFKLNHIKVYQTIWMFQFKDDKLIYNKKRRP